MAYQRLTALSIGFVLQKPTGQVVYTVGSMYLGQTIPAASGELLDVRFSLPCRLGSGQYLLSAAVAMVKGQMDYEVLHVLRESRVVTVVSNGRFGGDVDLQSTIQSVTRSAVPVTAAH
jgi:hypothetical protein